MAKGADVGTGIKALLTPARRLATAMVWKESFSAVDRQLDPEAHLWNAKALGYCRC